LGVSAGCGGNSGVGAENSWVIERTLDPFAPGAEQTSSTNNPQRAGRCADLVNRILMGLVLNRFPDSFRQLRLHDFTERPTVDCRHRTLRVN
jgi:hypothetical protein